MDEGTKESLVFDFFMDPRDVEDFFEGADPSEGFITFRFEDGIDMETGESRPMLRIVVDDEHEEILPTLMEELKDEGVHIEVNQLLVCG